ncbi:MAG: ribonuclease H-like YkuK family protein [Minisyncoccia bacterium]
MDESFKNLKFFNPTLGTINFKETVSAVVNYLLEKPANFYEIVVGCDSSATESPYFPVALVVRRVGEGGRFFLHKMHYSKKFYNLHERIIQEVYLSCKLALEFKEEFQKTIRKNNLKLNYQLQYIHADISENGDTKNMVKEIIGLIKSNGFEAKIKPESFAASSIADRFT